MSRDVNPTLMTVPPRLKRATRPPRGVSPLITDLERAAAEGDTDTEAFWERVERTGTPIVGERDDQGRRTATFLWRGGDELADVILTADRIAAADSYERNRMERIPGTDVWHLTYLMRSDWRASYSVAPVPADGTPAPENALSATTRTRRERALALSDPEDRPAVARWFDALAHARPDPRAREALDAHHSVVSLPEAPPRLRHDPDAPRGTLTRRTLASERLGNTRDVWIHRPAREPVDGTWTVAILLDGRTWHDLPLAPLLDGLIADGTLPPMLTVMVDSLDQATRTRELACHDLFVDFLDTELLPWLGELHPVTDDPGRTLIAGQSLGGLTALYAALRRPGRFGRVLSQSGSYWWPNPAVTGGETERTVRLVREADALPEHVHLSAGLHEWALLGANGRVHEALIERGRELGLPGDFADFTEYNGGHDKACWRVDLPHGLIALTEDHAR